MAVWLSYGKLSLMHKDLQQMAMSSAIMANEVMHTLARAQLLSIISEVQLLAIMAMVYYQMIVSCLKNGALFPVWL